MSLSKKQVLGIYIFLLGIAVLIKIIFPNIKIVFFVFGIFIVISINLIISSIKKDVSKKFIIPGITLFLLSTFLIIYFLFLSNITFSKIWPIMGLFPSIALISYYLISTAKSPATIIPGIFIAIISLVIFFNTADIVNINFKTFLIILIASMLIIIGLYLIFQKKIDEIKKIIEKNQK